ncbi:hypothetical protein AVEN_101799-1 [Araneus ventricosus]|uniref:DNA helicase Pif1-like 2B domain-containing protein n=1 Tax=Araneus ventricosus TaxID=182803 RepID=A0A4Y2CZC7_ARAVE|nr:hypothetical protein AVEN_101799-1 [Araneus ventricosus]
MARLNALRLMIYVIDEKIENIDLVRLASLTVGNDEIVRMCQVLVVALTWIYEVFSLKNGVPSNRISLTFFNDIELSGIPSDKVRLKFGVPELFIRNLDVPRLRNGTRFQITHLGPKVVLATDMTGIARVESAKFYAFR